MSPSKTSTTEFIYYPPDEGDILGINFKPGSVREFSVAYQYRVPSSQDEERGRPFMQARSEVSVEDCGEKSFSEVLEEILDAVASQEPMFSDGE